MNRRPNITEEQVYTAILTLRKDGEKVSARNILRITGGSLATIQRIMTKILDEELIEAMAPEINEKLLKDLKLGIGNAIRTGLKDVTEHRDDCLVLLDELDAEMNVADEQSKADIARLVADNRDVHAKQASSEILLAEAKTRIDFLEKQCQDLISGSAMKDLEAIVQKSVDAARASGPQN